MLFIRKSLCRADRRSALINGSSLQRNSNSDLYLLPMPATNVWSSNRSASFIFNRALYLLLASSYEKLGLSGSGPSLVSAGSVKKGLDLENFSIGPLNWTAT